jgi:hypothetical protein
VYLNPACDTCFSITGLGLWVGVAALSVGVEVSSMVIIKGFKKYAKEKKKESTVIKLI